MQLLYNRDESEFVNYFYDDEAFSLHSYERNESIANKDFGASNERYSWSQTIHDVTILIPVPSSTKGKNVDCSIESNHLRVGLRGNTPILDVTIVLHYYVEGTTFQRIKVDDSVWTLEGEGDNRVIRVELEKNEGDHWWPFVIEGEKEIDVSQINPPPVTVDSLEGSLRTQVEKMMVL